MRKTELEAKNNDILERRIVHFLSRYYVLSP